MKNFYRIFTTATVVTLLLFNSCVPEDEIVMDLAPKLTSGSWTFSSVEAGDDFSNGFYDGVYDGNVIDFLSDGTCTDKLNVFNGLGTWNLSSNQDIITLNIAYDDPANQGPRNESWRIKSITDTELVYEFDISPNTLEMKYVH